jgi:G3E family GTPase
LDPLKAAERVFTLFSGTPNGQSPGAAIAPGLKVQRLDLPETGGSQFTIRIPAAGRYWLFTEHLPSEFSLELRNCAGRAANPSAEHNFDPGHSHDERVGSFSIETTRSINAERFQTWLSDVLKTHGTRLYRMKGFLNFAGANDRIVIQGVHMVVDTTTLGPWGDQPRRTQLVFIGRELDRETISADFEVCLE